MGKIIVTEEMVNSAYLVLTEEINPPYSADVRDFSDEDIKAGKLKKADDEAEEMNRALVRRALEAAYSEEDKKCTSATLSARLSGAGLTPSRST